MTDMATTQDPEAIERDIRQTQEDMSRTVDRIGNQLTPRNILSSLLDKADDIDARALLDGARRNPLALAMIAGGAIWLASDRDAKLPSFRFGGASRRDGSNSVDHSASPDAMTRLEDMEHREGEGSASFRQHTGNAAQTLHGQPKAWSDQAQRAGRAILRSSTTALARTRDMYSGNPMLGGIVAAGVGVLFGTILPISRSEEERLAGLADTARSLASEQKDRLAATLRDKKDQLITSVEGQAQPAAAGLNPQPATIASTPQAAI